MKNMYEFVVSKKPFFDTFSGYNLSWKSPTENGNGVFGSEIAYVSEKILDIIKEDYKQDKKLVVIRTCEKSDKKPGRYELLKEPLSKEEMNILKRLLEKKKKNGFPEFIYIFP